jgi:hypothetical protein
MKRIDQEVSSQPQAVPDDFEEQVRLRAYQLYRERGEVPGFEVEDWLQAESEILGVRNAPKKQNILKVA